MIEEQDTTNEHNSGEETQDTKKEKKTQKKSDSQPGDESKDEEFTNYIQFSLEERKDFVLQKIQHSLDTEIENNDKEKTTDTYS
ncbi:hypothetical protein IJM86_00185 [bacterium]|nr:hypothetical protein [bacterium]